MGLASCLGGWAGLIFSGAFDRFWDTASFRQISSTSVQILRREETKWEELKPQSNGNGALDDHIPKEVGLYDLNG